MKQRVTIESILRAHVDPQIFSALEKICPEGVRGDAKQSFGITLESADPRLSRIEETLKSAGLSPKKRYAGRRISRESEYSRIVHKEYFETDLRSFELLELVPSRLINVVYTEASLPCLDAGELTQLQRETDVLVLPNGEIAISKRIKDLLERVPSPNAIFDNLGLSQCYDDGDREALEWEDFLDQWWRLSSSAIMPPLSSVCDIVDQDGQSRSPGFKGQWYLRDGDLGRPELVYQRDSIAGGIEATDVALTLEGDEALFKRIVVGQHIYERCIDAAVKAEWIPVHIRD